MAQKLVPKVQIIPGVEAVAREDAPLRSYGTAQSIRTSSRVVGA
jgi:hypothetical protein